MPPLRCHAAPPRKTKTSAGKYNHSHLPSQLHPLQSLPPPLHKSSLPFTRSIPSDIINIHKTTKWFPHLRMNQQHYALMDWHSEFVNTCLIACAMGCLQHTQTSNIPARVFVDNGNLYDSDFKKTQEVLCRMGITKLMLRSERGSYIHITTYLY